MPEIRLLKDFGGWKKGQKIEVPDDSWDFFKSATPASVYKLLTASTGKDKAQDTAEDEGEEMSMADVHTEAGLIMEPDKTYNFTLISHRVKKTDHETTDTPPRQFTRYHVPVLYEDNETTVSLPPSVIEEIWLKVKKADAVPLAEKKPVVAVSKHGEGKKTKYSVMYVGLSKEE